MLPGRLAVEEVRRADQRRRFHEVGRVLFADEPRWAPVLRTYEAWLFERRHPYHRGAEVVRFLARRSGDVVGRICAHHAEGDERGWFGAFDCADDPATVAALVDAAAEWASGRGAVSLAGPATFTLADEAGVLVDGYEHPGGTGRPWHPPWYVEHLAAAGLAPVAEPIRRWRLPTADPSGSAGRGPTTSTGSMAPGGPVPPQAGKLGDARLALVGELGAIAAVPDISPSLRSTSLRAARRAAAQATEAAIVRLEGDAAELVPTLLAAAEAAGYDHVWSPWCPPADAARPPDTVHRILGAPGSP